MLKTKAKLLIALLIMLSAICVFNMNIVNAATPNVILQDEIQEGVFSVTVTPVNDKEGIYLCYDPFKIYDLSKNTTKLNSLVQNDGYVYQSVYIELESGIDEVTIKENGKKLDIVNIKDSNYAKYDFKALKKENNKYIPINYWNDITIQFKENSQVKSEQQTRISYSDSGENGYLAAIVIVDENGKTKSLGTQGELGWMDTTISTANDYSDCYYRLVLNVNVGNSITIDGLGTFTYTGMGTFCEQDGYYYYQMKITDTSILSKAQDTTFAVEVVDINTKKGSYNIIELHVFGETRQTYTANDKSKNIGISLNGATGTGVSLKADTIDESNPTYIEMTNSFWSKGNYIVIGAYDIKLTGKYEGDLVLTFDLGVENNGKKVSILHRKADGTNESFNEVVTNGKVTITVTELSPFLLAYENTTGVETETMQDTESTENTNNKTDRKKDDTPKTGTTAGIYFMIPVAIISALGIMAFRRKETK